MLWLLLIPLAVAVMIFASVARDLLRSHRRAVFGRRMHEEADQRERHGSALAGGSAENPIVVTTPSVVEPMATAERCLRCAGDLHLLEHVVERRGADRIRVARVRCSRCGASRTLYYQLREVSVH